ncbi:MAG: acetyltransferase [Muribaculaceae bacterium]|nr:acetyltransferase [Muribaculaceae bacterium]
MKQLVIIGAGGMGRTLFDIARESLGYGTEFVIKGFIDDNIHALDGFENYPPVLSTIDGYMPQPDEVFTFSIGGEARRACITNLVEKGAVFINLIHRTARIGTNVHIGTGNIIAAYTTLGADCSLGSYNMIQSYSVIGHDATIGDFNRIDTHVTCVGGIRILDESTIHTGAVINHNVTVGCHAKVGALSFVIRNVRDGVTVFGSPARKM